MANSNETMFMKMETLLDSDKKDEKRQEDEKEDKPLVETLSDVQTSAAKDQPRWPKAVDSSQCPVSYKLNSSRESRMLQIANNFQSQYLYLYPDRKPLLLCPTNECGVQKFVSTTLRPSVTPHSELRSWEGCASFVADFLSLELLEPPDNTPSCLSSPTWVLTNQRGTCFEFSTVLCSLLLGLGFDAYCVSGYAVQDMCLLDQSMENCPLLEIKEKVVIPEKKVEVLKYAVKPPRELKSRFEAQQEKKKQEAGEAALLHQQQEAQRLEEESARPPPDTLHGRRVHCWVLVLSGKRVSKNFFIDPLTGKSYTTADHHFLGIESVWNHHNYWVNMKTCSSGCDDIVFDLDDLESWEPVLCDSANQEQLTLKGTRIGVMSHDDEEEWPKVFQMPRSWIIDVTVSKKDLELRWPGGHKLTRYKKAQLEMFAPYIMAGGLVKRLSIYKHFDYSEPVMVTQWYSNRADRLQQKEINIADQVTTEHFSRGHSFQLKVHRYTNSQSTANERVMEFYSQAHVDGLVRRMESPLEMTETFQGRHDFLYYRHVVFRCGVQYVEQDSTDNVNNLTIQKIVERFHRNRSKPAKEDVAERFFLVAEGQIEVKYHLGENRIIPITRTFTKPQESTEAQKAQEFTPDMVSSFEIDWLDKPFPTFPMLKEIFMDLMKNEKQVLQHITDSKKEVKDILACREQQERDLVLEFFPWSFTGPERAHQHREITESLVSEEQQYMEEEDVLAPFVLGIKTPEDAQEALNYCLSSLKQRQLDYANIIQERYQKATKELQDKQLWYQQNQMNLSKEQQDQYLQFCCDKTLQISVARKRLDRHERTAPQTYQALLDKLKQDPRLAFLQDKDTAKKLPTC